MYSTPARSPAIPGIFKVPASNRVGISSGCSRSKVRIPVPPTRNGFIFTPSRTQMPPMPCGPRRPLCPEKHSTSMCICSISIGRRPADCAASTRNNVPFSRHKAPSFSRSLTLPVRFDAWVQTSALVSGRILAARTSRHILPFSSQGMMVRSTPSFSFRYKGRSTELCSIWVVITWSPGSSSPSIAIFRLSVAFMENATWFGCG